MALSESLSTAVATLREHPLIFVVGFAYAVLVQLGTAVQFFDGAVSSVVGLAFVFVYPFLFAGLVGMVDAALDGGTSLEQFVASGRSNYLSLLGALLLIGIVTGVVFVVAAVLALLLSILLVGGLSASGSAGSALAGFGLLAVVFGLALVLVTLLGALFLQFVAETIVLDGAGAVESISKSAGLVRRHFASVLGFSVVFGVLSLVLQGPSQVLYYLAVDFPVGPDQQGPVVGNPSLLGASVVLGVVLGTLAIALLTTFHVAYYRSIRDDGGSGGVNSRTADSRAAT